MPTKKKKPKLVHIDHCSFIHYSQFETTQMSINRKMVKHQQTHATTLNNLKNTANQRSQTLNIIIILFV
jgi:hypothetical protein